MDAGLPAEAKRISDEGFASGALGTGADADAQKRLRDAAAKQVVDDQKQLAQSAKAATPRERRRRLVNVGFALRQRRPVRHGHPHDGAGHRERRSPAAGRGEAAPRHRVPVRGTQGGRRPRRFSGVGGADGTAELARLWLIYAQRPSQAERRHPGSRRPIAPLRFLLQALTRTPLPVLYAWGGSST